MKKLISFVSILTLGLIMAVAPVNNSYAQNSGSSAGKVSFGLAPTNFLNKSAEIQAEKDAALLDAVKANNLQGVKGALDNDANIRVVSSADAGKTPLMIAAKDGYKSILDELLKRDGSTQHIRMRSTDDWTALIYAAYAGRLEIVKALLAEDSEIAHAELKNGDGYTALDWAIYENHVEIAKALNAVKAPLSKATVEEYKALTDEEYKGATTATTTTSTQTTQSTTTTNQTQSEKDKALLDAVKANNLQGVKGALGNGASIKAVDTTDRDMTSLMIAAKYGYKSIVDELLERDGSPEHIRMQDKDDYTALMWAAYNGHLDVVNALLAADSDIAHTGLKDSINNNNMTALDRALADNRKDVAIALNAVKAPLGVKSAEEYNKLTGEDYWNVANITEEKKAEGEEVEETAVITTPAGCSPSQQITGDKDLKQYIYHNTALYNQKRGFNCSNECDGAIVNMGNGGSGEYHFDGKKTQKLGCKIDKYTCKNNVWTITSTDAPWAQPIGVAELSAYQTNCNGAMTPTQLNAQLLTAVAANGDNVDAVENLIKVGANINAVDANGNTALDLAIKNNNAKIAQYLKSIGAVQKNTTADQYNALIATLKTVKEEGSTDDAAARALQQQIARVENISAKINATVGALDVSVWRNEEGKFNTSRLLSDSIAGVVLGTAGGLITSSVMKKSQVEKGYENIECTVGNQSVANWGDEFVIGMTINQ